MNISIYELVLFLSLAANGYLFFLFKKKPTKQESYEAQELLRDLLTGSALIEVRRIAPTDVFLRSPRDAQ